MDFKILCASIHVNQMNTFSLTTTFKLMIQLNNEIYKTLYSTKFNDFTAVRIKQKKIAVLGNDLKYGKVKILN